SELLGVDVRSMLARFQPNVSIEVTNDEIDLEHWLAAQRGAQRLTEVATKSELSRYSVGRFLTGQSQPRLPQFLRLIEALTQRADEFVDAWVGIENVPALRPRFERVQAARQAMVQQPLCLAAMCLLDTRAFRDMPRAEQEARLSTLLECP